MGWQPTGRGAAGHGVRGFMGKGGITDRQALNVSTGWSFGAKGASGNQRNADLEGCGE